MIVERHKEDMLWRKQKNKEEQGTHMSERINDLKTPADYIPSETSVNCLNRDKDNI